MSVSADYTVRVAWEAVPENAFALDVSQLDSSKQLTSQFSSLLNVLQFGFSTFDGTDEFAGPFGGLYTDVSPRVKSISTKRGRSDNLDAFTAGEAVVVLHDPEGKFNPLNTDSVLYPFVVPGRPIEIEAQYDGQVLGTFRGFVRSIEHDPTQTARESRLMCQDLFLYLDRAKPELTNTGPTTTGTAIGRVLDAIGWTEVDLRDLAAGDDIDGGWPLGGEGQGSETGLALIQKLLEVERGEFFHGRDGVVRYRDRFARYKRTSAVTLTDVAAAASPAADLTNIRNRAKVTKTGTGEQSYTDQVSVTNYGPSDATSIESRYLNSPEQALSLAQWIVKQTATPSPPVRALEYVANTSDALMVNALTREIGDRITVADAASGVSSTDFYIEGIEHKIERGGKHHTVRFALSKAPTASPIMFDVSRIVDGEFSSPTTDVDPYTTASTAPDIFAF